LEIEKRSLWGHQSDDSQEYTAGSDKPAMQIEKTLPVSRMHSLIGRLYFIVPFMILGAMPLAEYIVNGILELTFPTILIVLASVMCLITWTMNINSNLTNLMPVVITAISAIALAMLMVSKTPDLHMQAAASMMIMMVWLTSAPNINVYIQTISSLLIVTVLSYLLITAHLLTQNLVTVFVLLISGMMMGLFTQLHRRLQIKDEVVDDLLSGDLSNIVYDQAEEEMFEEAHDADLEQDWPEVLEKLNKSLGAIHDVDVLFNKMLVILHDAIPFKAASVGMLQGSSLKNILSYGTADFMTADTLNWSNDFIRSMGDRQQEVTNTISLSGKVYYRLDLPIISNTKLVGVVTIIRENEEFDNYSCKLSKSILFHSMVSLKNARLYEEFKKLKSQGKQTTLITREQFMQASGKQLLKLNEPRSASLMIVEIDHFDKLEERYTKETSLAVYNAIVSLLLDATDNSDILGRYGKEGYIILLNDTDLLIAKKKAERIRELIANTPCKTVDGKITTTVSIGLSSASHSDEDIMSLSQRAGMALYVAKESGKNSVKVKL